MLREVDQLVGFSDAAQRRFGDCFRFTGEGDHRAVVIGVALAIEQIDAFHLAHGCDNGVDLGDVAPFGKIRNALNQSFHFKAPQPRATHLI